MNGLLLRPVSRVIRVQRPVACCTNLSRTFATTTCRKFGPTGPANKRKNLKNLPPSNAEFFGEGIEEVTKGLEEVPQAATMPAPKRQQRHPQIVSTLKPSFTSETFASSAHGEDAALSSQSKHATTSYGTFDPTQYFSSWSSETAQAELAARDISLVEYMARLVQTPASLNVLAGLNADQKWDFEKRWVQYETEQDNQKNLIPVLEFFLRHGLQFPPPTPNSLDSLDSEDIPTIDPAAVEKGFATVGAGPWQNTASLIKDYPTEYVPYPDLMTPDALLDPRDVLDLPPSKDSPYHNRVIVRNHRSVFHNYAEEATDDLLEDDDLPENDKQDADEMLKALPVPSKYYGNLHQSILMRRSVVQQTGKGKIRRVAFMVLVGDGNGLVGYGEGKHSNGAVALKAARLSAVKNMDWVERFEKRTIWTETSTKLGATQIIFRPRPVGFGLRCNPFLHRILRAAGLKDISAKVWGSRNKLNVIKAAFRMLHAGHAPTGMGDGIGGKGKKLSKGGGLKSKSDVERARGRKLINLRK